MSSLSSVRRRFAAATGLALALAAAPAHAQIDPQRVAIGQPVTSLYQVQAGVRVDVGVSFVEPGGLAGPIEHRALYDTFDPALPVGRAPSEVRLDGVGEFLLAARQVGAELVEIGPTDRRCQPTPTCVTLGRDGGDVADALIRADEPERNFGGSGSLSVSDGGSTRRGLLRFGLERIPAGAVVTSASLELSGLLYGTPTTIYPLLAPWDERTVTWSSFVRSGVLLGAGPAGPYVDRAAAVLPVVLPGGVGGVSLLALVQGWLDGSIANHGVLLGRHGGEGLAVFASHESPLPALRPQLTVCYQACAEDCPRGCAPGEVCAAGACLAVEEDACAPADDGGACSGHGVWALGRCFCEPGFAGESCEDVIGCASDCSGNGVCLHGQCFCEPGFAGESCEDVIGCADGCNDRGLCLYGQCFCQPGYTGAACEGTVRD